MHEDVTSQERSKERLYEEEIELKWEKGGSGLVFYTDAQYWQEEEGGIQQKLYPLDTAPPSPKKGNNKNQPLYFLHVVILSMTSKCILNLLVQNIYKWLYSIKGEIIYGNIRAITPRRAFFTVVMDTAVMLLVTRHNRIASAP